MPIQDDWLAEVAIFNIADEVATLQSVRNVSCLRAVGVDWSAWTARHGGPPAVFNWVSVFNFNSAQNILLLALEIAQTAQALMMLRVGYVVRCDGAAREPLVYVGFLEVAPWNMTGRPDRRYRGLGPVMIGIAHDLSLQQGIGGSVGLHSVSAAEGFYRRIGLRSLDCPNEYNEVYLELDVEARALLQGRDENRWSSTSD